MVHLAASRDVVIPGSRYAVAGRDPGTAPTATDDTLLQLLRTRAINTQLAPRVEPFRFCALIATAPDRGACSYVDGLLHVLPQALGRPLLVRRPGGATPSFDEAWIIGLIASMKRGDGASIQFALASRVSKPFRRPLAFILNGLSRRLDGEAERTRSG
ncbi:MAG: hypothetical protein AAFR52_20920 [Pseudomonadota bacterium]